MEAQAGKAVVLHFRPDPPAGNSSLVINGFEIDTSEPRKKAIEPVPANDDEHVPDDSALTWTAPPMATAHQLYFGADSNAVAQATPASPEFKGNLIEARYMLTPGSGSLPLSPRGTSGERVGERGSLGSPDSNAKPKEATPSNRGTKGLLSPALSSKGGEGEMPQNVPTSSLSHAATHFWRLDAANRPEAK